MTRISRLANYEDIFDRSPEPALLLDLEDRRILDASLSAERILGNEEGGCLNGIVLDSFIPDEAMKHYSRQMGILKRKFYPRRFETIVHGLSPKCWDAEIMGNMIELKDSTCVLIINIKDITIQKKHEELQNLSLKNAKMVVDNMLPDSIPQPQGYSIAVHYEACSEIGGDFYDFIHLSEKKLGLCIGDAKGHGLEAALVMGMVRKALNICATGESHPSSVLCATNSTIAPDLNKGNFATCFYGILDPKKHLISFSSAGHNHSIVLAHDSNEVREVKGKGLPLGFGLKGNLFEKTLSTQHVELMPGDVFIQYTDGIIEAANKKGEFYEMQRFNEILIKLKDLSAQEICDGVISDLKAFLRKEAQQDDISLMVMQRLVTPDKI
jgi:sigma-B regulation protein RsbU (phosphoserine phosphatase)